MTLAEGAGGRAEVEVREGEGGGNGGAVAGRVTNGVAMEGKREVNNNDSKKGKKKTILKVHDDKSKDKRKDEGSSAAAVKPDEDVDILELGDRFRQRRDSIQERRKQRQDAECSPLRLPISFVRSESSPLLLGRGTETSPASTKSESPSSHSSPRSPALKVLNKVFSFKERCSPPWSPKSIRRNHSQTLIKTSPTDSKKRRSLHLSLSASESLEAKWFPDTMTSLSRGSNSPKSPSSPRSPNTSHAQPPQRSQFFVPITKTKPDNGFSDVCEVIPGVIYRPHTCRRTAMGRHHWRTKSDTFSQSLAKVEVPRKRSRDDSECDSLPFDVRSKGVDGSHYLPRGPGLDDRMRAEISGDNMLDLLEKMAKYRLDDQRCSLPHPILYPAQGVREGPGKPPPDKEEPQAKASSRTRLEETLSRPPPYRQVVLPENREYWDETPAGGDDQDCTTNNNNNNNINNNDTNKFETDESATYYRRYFLGQEHWNFYSEDASQGPVVVSQRRETVGTQDLVHLLVRLNDGLHHATIPASGHDLRPAALVKRVKEDLSVERFSPVVSPEAPQLILEYDEHTIKNQFKFGLIVQRFHQTVEEQLFANTGHSQALEQFLSLMGRRVKLREHEGFKGGLDTQYGQTGEESLYEVFREKEVMFHVSTMLPFKEQDPQQLERKRHIGNDMVAVVFQEQNTPFAPDMVASHFLHAYVVVQPIDPCTPNTRYRVSVTARSDVPFFGPTLPHSSTFAHGPLFKDFLLTKLINAEMACYKAHRFATLEARTRKCLLATLADDLRTRTNGFLGQAEVQEAPKAEPPTTRFRDIVASLIGRKNQDVTNTPGPKKAPQTPNTLLTITPTSIRSKGSGESSGPRTPPSSPDTTPNTHLALSESDDSSLNSMDIDSHPHPLNEDSDTGLESMSSAETPHKVAAACPLCGGQEESTCALHADPEAVLRQVEALKQEINKLKCDKLDLLRQNVTCQRDIKKLKEKELKHSSDLASASKEITRLQGLLSDFGTGQVSTV